MKMLETKNYTVVRSSWHEKRHDLFAGIETLPADLKDEAGHAVASLGVLRPQWPPKSSQAKLELENDHFELRLDDKTGAIHKLRNKSTGRDWASREHPLALFSYQAPLPTGLRHIFQELRDQRGGLGPRKTSASRISSVSAQKAKSGSHQRSTLPQPRMTSLSAF